MKTKPKIKKPKGQLEFDFRENIISRYIKAREESFKMLEKASIK